MSNKKRKPFRWESEQPPKAIVVEHSDDNQDKKKVDEWISKMKQNGKLKDREE